MTPDGTNNWFQVVVPRERRRALTIYGRVSTNLIQSATGAPHTAAFEDATNRLNLRSTTPVNTAPEQFMDATVAFP